MVKRLSQIVLVVAMLLATLPVARSEAQTVEPLPPVTEADGRMGTCYAFYDTTRIQQAYDAGSRWDRFDFRWNAIAEYGYGPQDQLIDRYASLGWPLHIVGILGAAPDIYANCPASAQTAAIPLAEAANFPVHITAAWWNACPPINLDLAWNDPNNVWGQYVYQTALRYRGRVDVWEVWNEPDLTLFWQGTAAQYAQLLKVAYLAIKAANPDATVLFGGLAYWYNPNFYKQVLDAIAADPESASFHGYFDVMSLHLYSNVETPYDISREVMAEVASRVGPHPLWLTETGVPVWDDGGTATPYAATMEEAASYIIEAYADARAAGVDKFFVFRLHDDGGSEHYGLTRDDYSLRPSYVAYQVAARYLRGENQITGPFGTSLRRITFWGTPNGRVDVLWNRTTETLTYAFPATLPTATLIDRHGVEQTVEATNGYFHLTLEPVTNPLIGGPPLILIQRDTQPPQTLWLEGGVSMDALHLRWAVSDDAAGYWYEEIERANSPDGPWTQVAGWSTTDGTSELSLPLPDETMSWYFRARARDRVGNYEPWEEAALTTLTIVPRRTVVLTVTATLAETGEPVTARMRWLEAGGQLITETVADSWVVTTTVPVPQSYYVVVDGVEGYLPQRFDFAPDAVETTASYTFHAALREIVGRLYFPLIFKWP